jgi:hypothetical protein
MSAAGAAAATTTTAYGPSRKDHVVVDQYLNQIYQATKVLARRDNNNEDDNGDTEMEVVDEDNNSNLSADANVDRIAQMLLSACTLEMLSLGVSHLPPINIFDFDETINVIASDDEEHFFYQHRRTDYLRRLLRLMAPISMEVCAAVLSKVLLANTTKDSSNLLRPKKVQHYPSQIAAILLLSHWLAVAPHLMPMAIEFLQVLSNDPWQQLFRDNIV